MQPGKRAMVQQAFQPVVQSTVAERIKSREKECIELVGEKRFKELSSDFNNNKINMLNIIKNKQLSLKDRKTLYLI